MEPSFGAAGDLLVSAYAAGCAVAALRYEGKDYEDANKTAEANKNTADQLVEDIKEVNDEIAEQAKLIESANQAIAQQEKEIELSEKDIAEVEDEISEKRQALGAVLSTIYGWN